MHRLGRVLALALLAFIATTGNAGARSKKDDEDYGTGFFSNLSYSVALGAFVPAGSNGAELDIGCDARAAVHWEMTPGLVMGPEVGVAQSPDPLRIRIVHYGVHARIYPERDYPNIYVHLGAAAYNVTYNPDTPTPGTPPNRTRPGGSFGIGFEFNPYSKLSVGIESIYHGIAMSSSDALSYVTGTFTLTLRPFAL
jgi:hypothetical protein